MRNSVIQMKNRSGKNYSVSTRWNVSEKITYYTDSLYNVDKESFKKQVISSVQQIVEREEMLRLADGKEKEQEN
jgi:hypothetical protein